MHLNDRPCPIATPPVHPALLTDGTYGPQARNEHAPTAVKRIPGGLRRVLEYVRQNPAAAFARIAHDLGISESTAQRQTNVLKLDGLLEREGSARTGQ